MILSYDAYTESLEKQQKEKTAIETLQEEIDDIKQFIQSTKQSQ
jgi:hypothetical protein